MELLVVECLRCGHQRSFAQRAQRFKAAGDCPRCRYVGWADASELTEETRGLCRDFPPEQRLRLRVLHTLRV